MNSDSSIRRKAERVLQEHGLFELPVDPFEIAEALDLSVMPMPTGYAGSSAMLVHWQGHFGIGYPTHVKNEGFQRFSVSHEIGHYVLPGHVDAIVSPDTTQALPRRRFGRDRFEEEADRFATFLLMPTALFTAELRGTGDGFEAVKWLSERCRTSWEATAIRYVECARQAIAVVRTTGDRVDYVFPSRSLRRQIKPFPALKGKPLPANTATFHFNKNRRNIQNSKYFRGESSLAAWFGASRAEPLIEEVIGLGSYGKTLSILTSGRLGMDPARSSSRRRSRSKQPRAA